MLDRTNLDKAAAKGAHAVFQVIARTADHKTSLILLRGAFHGRVERSNVFKDGLVNARGVNFREKTLAAKRSS